MTRLESWTTALTVSALCLLAMVGGWSLLRLGTAQTPDDLRALIDDRFVGGAALLDLVVAETDTALDVRARDLEALLRRAPLVGGAWLDLAAIRRARGEDLASVIEALRMSARVGPREARLMTGRASVALPLWPVLPEAAQPQILADMAGVAPYLEPPEQARLASLIEAQSPPARDRICAYLQARGAVLCPPSAAGR